MIAESEETINRIGTVLANTKLPMKERFRALFTLKNLGGNLAIENIAKCFIDDSCLLKHELAYCLGQMKDEYAIPYLIEVLKDDKQEPMVRHEAGIAINYLRIVIINKCTLQILMVIICFKLKLLLK